MEISSIHINQYINEELHGEALTIFEAKLKTDKAFRDKVNMHKEIDVLLMKNYLDLDEEAHVKEKERLQPIFDEMKAKHLKEIDGSKTTIRKIFPYIAVLAAACLLLFIFNPFAQNTSPPQLADQYFKVYEPGSFMDGGDQPTEGPNQLLTQASQYYKNNQIEKAIEILQQVVEQSSAVYKQKANWYLALCYLKQNQTQKAKSLLEELKQNRDYEEDAKTILDQL